MTEVKTLLSDIIVSNKNLNGQFMIGEYQLSDREVRKLALWGIRRGYEYDVEIPDNEAMVVLGLNNEDAL